MKTLLFRILFFFLIITFVSGGLAMLGYTKLTQPADPSDRSYQQFEVKKDESVSDVGQRLEEAGLIKSAFVWRVYLKVHPELSQKIQAGSFELSSSSSLSEIIGKLEIGRFDKKLTIIEGLRSEEIAGVLIKQGFTNQASVFLNLARNASLKDYSQGSAATTSLEGYLFPDTYNVSEGISADQLVRLMVNNFFARVDSKILSSYQKTGLDLNQAVTLASIVEREAAKDEDRRIISGILLKRLQNSMPLQADATIQYVKGDLACRVSLWEKDKDKHCEWWPTLSLDDLKTDSPFNTYLNSGLPPHPIANPSLSSILAVANPKETSFWYYLSDNMGSTHYAKTLDEQEQNMGKYLNH